MDLPLPPSSPEPHPLLAYPAVADVLLDRVQLGFEMRLPSVPVGRVDAVAVALARAGLLVRAPAPGSALAGPLPLGLLTVPLVKGGKGGVVGGQILLAAPAGGGLVLTARSHLILNSMRDLRRVWARAAAAAGLPEGLRIHDLRHSFASVLANLGTPLNEIGVLLGHQQLSTTQRYAHHAPQRLVATAAAATLAWGLPAPDEAQVEAA